VYVATRNRFGDAFVHVWVRGIDASTKLGGNVREEIPLDNFYTGWSWARYWDHMDDCWNTVVRCRSGNAVIVPKNWVLI
jgi:hypothetical protein